MKISTLVIIIDQENNKILLAMKKRGFGANLWNSTGGKVKPGESIETAAIRETKEEINIDVKKLKSIGQVIFHFPNDPEAESWQVNFFRAIDWSGIPIETEEMLPKWFDFKEIPYSQMWVDDQYWLPQVIAGKSVKGILYFNNDNTIISYDFKFSN